MGHKRGEYEIQITMPIVGPAPRRVHLGNVCSGIGVVLGRGSSELTCSIACGKVFSRMWKLEGLHQITQHTGDAKKTPWRSGIG